MQQQHRHIAQMWNRQAWFNVRGWCTREIEILSFFLYYVCTSYVVFLTFVIFQRESKKEVFFALSIHTDSFMHTGINVDRRTSEVGRYTHWSVESKKLISFHNQTIGILRVYVFLISTKTWMMMMTGFCHPRKNHYYLPYIQLNACEMLHYAFVYVLNVHIPYP